jgi:hypothetical protein
MTLPYADAQAHNAIPDEFLECLLTRRHSFPMKAQRAQHVRIAFGPGKGDVLELTEYVGTCTLCTAERTLNRDRYANTFVDADYVYPDGYLPPAGTRWDRELLWDLYHRRHPIKGRVRVVNR